MEEKETQNKKNWHDRNYKLLLLIPAVLLLFSIVYMGVFYSQNGDFIRRDISLTGGTTATIYGTFDRAQVEIDLFEKLEDLNTREISDLITGEQTAIVIETKTPGGETKDILEDYFGYELTGDNSSFEFTGSTLSEGFYRQLVIAVFIAFIFMAIVVFIIFRTFIPSMAVIISAIADILMTLVLFNILGLKMSSAGIVALLMLIGYSVDTDILLTTRMIKRREGSVNERLLNSFKTGITMTLTSLVAIGFALIVVSSFSEVLTQIFLILVIGLGFDILNTWITNASIIKWYVLEKEK